MLSTEECSCDIDEDMIWVQSTIYKLAFQRTFGSVSFDGHKANPRSDSFRVSNVLGACPNLGAQAVPCEVRMMV